MIAVTAMPDAAQGVSPDFSHTAATATSSATVPQPLHLERLQELDGSTLRQEWRRLLRSEPPRISRDLLARAVAYRLQELEFGGLPKWARQTLAGSAGTADPAGTGDATKPRAALPRLKLGARIVREWHGRTHSVIVLDDAFEFEGRGYRSLTQIACEITGAHWSGPRFFGLMKRRAGAELGPTPALQDGQEQNGGFMPSRKRALPSEAPNDIDGGKCTDANGHGRRRAKENTDG
jgi:hypothetical protein